MIRTFEVCHGCRLQQICFGGSPCDAIKKLKAKNKQIKKLRATLKMYKDIIENDTCDTCKYLLKKYIARETFNGEEKDHAKKRGRHKR